MISIQRQDEAAALECVEDQAVCVYVRTFVCVLVYARESVCSAALPPGGGVNILWTQRPVTAVWQPGGNRQTVTCIHDKHSVHKNQKHCDTHKS